MNGKKKPSSQETGAAKAPDLAGRRRDRPSDLDRLCRHCAMPRRAACRLQDRDCDYGLGWAVAGQALTPFEDIAPNPWGPMTEVRQTPVLATETRIAIWDDAPAFPLRAVRFACSPARTGIAACAAFSRRRLPISRRETGLTIAAAFEHEFLLSGNDLPWIVPFSVEQMRVVAPFTADLTRALLAADVGLETVEPEYGVRQYEISCAPAIGVAGCRPRRHRARSHPRSRAPPRLPRQLHAEAHALERRQWRACAFQPGRQEGREPDFRCQRAGATCRSWRSISPPASCAYMPEFCALVAPSPVSYLRLGPHHWSCGYAAFGVQNREATIRACPSPDPKKHAQAFNLELRPPDATASPYMVLGALVRAGLEGIRQKLPLPPILDRDPADYSETERKALGVRSLPSSLGEALDLMLREQDRIRLDARSHARVLCRGEAQGDRDVRRSRRRRPCASGITMPIESVAHIPLIDHHCHGVSPADLDWKQFQALFSESYRPPPPGTNEFQKPLGLAIRAFCAPLLDLEPHVIGRGLCRAPAAARCGRGQSPADAASRPRLPHRRYRPSLQRHP